jgi:hypothetical protein
MSFTQDELQAFNAILDQRLAAQLRAMERSLDQRINMLKHEFDQRLGSLQQNLLRSLPQRLSELQGKLRDDVNQKLDTQQTNITQAVKDEIEASQQAQSQQFEDQIERALAAQLLAMEQLITQRSSNQVPEFTATYGTEAQPDFESIEVQTEIPWEDLVDVVDKAMDQRLATLSELMQTTMQAMEQFLAGQLQNLREELVHAQEHSFSGSAAHMQDIFTSIEQLEHVIESMQVAMNANHALLSNRLYHHQNLPSERAHSGGRTTASLSQGKHNSITTPLPLLQEHEDEPSQE